MNHIGENVVRIEAEALRELADRIAGPMAADFTRAVELLFCCAGRVVVTGMGKSGLIGLLQRFDSRGKLSQKTTTSVVVTTGAANGVL